MPSCTSPWLVAPSPKNAMVASSVSVAASDHAGTADPMTPSNR